MKRGTSSARRRLEVVLALLVARRLVAIEEVVVEPERDTAGARCASNCTASRFENVVLPEDEGPAIRTTLIAVALRGDVGGDARDARLVQRLADQRDLGQQVADDGVVQRADAADAEAVEPARRARRTR